MAATEKIITPYTDVPFLETEPEKLPDFEKMSSMQIGFGSRVMRANEQGLWMGAEKFEDAPFSVDMEGNITASSLDLSGFLEEGEAAADINSHATTVSGGKITAGSITASQIAASTITADKLSVSTLSAISANLGTITAGTISAVSISGSTITGSTLTTATSGQRVVLTSTFASYYNSSGTNIVNTLASSSSFIIQAQTSTGSIFLDAGASGSVAFLENGTSRIVYSPSLDLFAPFTNGSIDLGTAGANWRDLYMNGDFVYRGVDQPIIYHGTVSGTSVLNDNTAFSVSNSSTGIYVVTHNFGTDNYSVNVTPFASTVKNITVSSQGNNSFTVRIANLSDTLENNDFFFQVMLMP